MAICIPSCFKFSVQSMIWGYHVYQDEWDAVIGEVLHCRWAHGNRHNPYVVVTTNDGRVVRHVPKNSPICSKFIRRGGSITCTVSGHRRYSADLEKEGSEIPCNKVLNL